MVTFIPIPFARGIRSRVFILQFGKARIQIITFGDRITQIATDPIAGKLNSEKLWSHQCSNYISMVAKIKNVLYK